MEKYGQLSCPARARLFLPISPALPNPRDAGAWLWPCDILFASALPTNATYYVIKTNRFNEVANDTLDECIYFLKTAEIKDDKYQWSKEELKAYDNVGIKEQDERGEKELAAFKAKEEGKIEMILEMDKEGFTISQIAKLSKKRARGWANY